MIPRWLLALALVPACWGPGAEVPAGPPPPKSLQINAPGKVVDIEAMLPPGYVTVVDFWAESCGACHVVGGMLAIQVALDDRVVIRKVDVGDGLSEVSDANGINALPHYKVYDKHKRMRADLVGNDCLQAPQIALALAAEP